MKQFLKALVPATFLSIIIVLVGAVFQWLLYGLKEFEDFFGVAVGKFNLLHYLIVFIVLTVIFAMYFKEGDRP